MCQSMRAVLGVGLPPRRSMRRVVPRRLAFVDSGALMAVAGKCVEIPLADIPAGSFVAELREPVDESRVGACVGGDIGAELRVFVGDSREEDGVCVGVLDSLDCEIIINHDACLWPFERCVTVVCDKERCSRAAFIGRRNISAYHILHRQ